MTDVIQFTRNDDSIWQMTLKKADGSAYPLTNCSFTLRVKTNRTDPDSATLITKTTGNGISAGDATGIVTITFVPTDTADLIVDKVYDYDVELTTVAGLKFTILRSHFKVLQD